MTATRRPISIILAIAAVAPAALTALFIHHFGVNARYYDDWWFFSDLLVKGAHGSLTFRDLFAQYNESRTVFPRLVILALNKLFHGDIRSQYYFSLLLACATAINLYILSGMTGQPLIRRLWLLCLASVLIFTPVQYQTWLWGVQIVVFFPIFSLSLALLIVESRLPRWPKLIAAALVCLFATFSHANGMLLWPLIGFAIFAGTPWRRDLIAPLLFWIVLSLAPLPFYFHGYFKPSWTPGFLPALQHPLTTIHFFFALLGMPLGWGYTNHTIAISTLLGFFQIALLLFLIARIIRKKTWRGPALPWLILAAHVLLTAALTAAGAGFGVQYAATLRYTSYSLFITVAIVYLVPFAFDAPRQLAWKIFAIVAIFLTLLTIQPACGEASATRAKYLAGRATLHYILVLHMTPQPGGILTSENDADFPKAVAALDSIGYLHPPLAKSTTIEPAQTPALGHLDRATFDNNTLTVTGVALLPNRPADAVVIAAGHGPGIARASAVAVFPLADPSAEGHFAVTMPANLPTGPKDIVAFAIDGYTGEAYPLANTFPISK